MTCIQISQEAGKVVCYSHLCKNFPPFVVIHTVKGFSAVNEAEVLLEVSCIQISQEAGQVVCYCHLFQNFPRFIVIHTVKGFGIVYKEEVDAFQELSCIFSDPTDVSNLIFGSSAFSKSSLNIWKFSVQVLWKPCLENFNIFRQILNLWCSYFVFKCFLF